MNMELHGEDHPGHPMSQESLRSRLSAVSDSMAPVGAPERNCSGCGKAASSSPSDAGGKLRSCSKCLLVRYCSSGCQVSHWPAHKASCQAMAAMRDLHENATGDTARPTSKKASLKHHESLMKWYYSVEMLPLKVMCLAWQNRQSSPMLRVHTGRGSAEPHTTAVPRSEWGNPEVQKVYKGEDHHMYAAALVVGDVFDGGHFDPKKQFVLFLDISHPDFVGSSDCDASSVQIVTFHSNIHHMVMLNSMYTAKTPEEKEALMSKARANPAITGGVFELPFGRARVSQRREAPPSLPMRASTPQNTYRNLYDVCICTVSPDPAQPLCM